MLGVIANVCFLDKLNISPQHRLLCQLIYPRQAEYRRIIARIHHAVSDKTVILTVLRYDHVKHTGVFQRPQHHGGVLHAAAVVGKADGPRLRHKSHFRKLDTFPCFGDSAHRIDVGLSCLPGLSMDVFDVGLIFDRRVCIRHTDDRGKARRHRRRRAARYRLFFFIARLAKVNVNINKPRHNQLTGGINNRSIILSFEF